MVMSRRDLVVELDANTGKLTAGFSQAAASASVFERELDKVDRAAARQAAEVERAAERQRQAYSEVGTVVAGAGVAIMAGLGLATKAAMDWESAWAGVTKTVGGNASQMGALEGQLRALTKELPAAHREIAAVAEAAGALGISRGGIVEFTRTMINLGETTDLTSDQAANALARISNVMGTGEGDIDRFGASLVALGNDGASTESEIVMMAQRISGAAKQVGLSEGELLGVSSALSSVGIEAEAGGSSFSTFLVRMSQAVSEGGEQLGNFAQVAGVSTAEFSRLFKEDAAGATVAFVEGLGRIQASGGDTFGTLEQLGFTEIRLRDALLRTAGAGDLLAQSIRTGNDSWVANSALTDEAAKRYETTAAQMGIARNQIADFAITMGETFLPILGQVVGGVTSMIEGFAALPQPVQTGIAVLGAITGGVALVGGAALIAVPKIVALQASFTTLAASSTASTAALGRAGGRMMALGGPLAVATVGIGLLAMEWGKARARQDEYAAAARTIADVLNEQGGAINAVTRETAAQALENAKLDSSQKGLLTTLTELGISSDLATEAALGNAGAQRKVVEQLDAIKEREDRGLFTWSLDRLTDTGKVADEASEAFSVFNVEQGKVAESDRVVADAATGTANAQRDGAAAAGENAAALEGLSGELEEAIPPAEAFRDALDALTGRNLTADEAMVRYHESIRRTSEAIRDNGANTNLATEAGGRNNDALRAQAESAATLTQAQIDLHGPTNAIRDGFFAQRQALFESAREAGHAEEAAWRLVDSYLAVPESIRTPFYAETGPARAAIDAYLRDHGHHTLVVTVNADTGPARTAIDNALRSRGLYRPLAGDQYRAAGGRIYGPGGETEDKVPLWGSPNEHMWAADEVRGAGGHEEVERMRALARNRQLPRLAFGGRVGGGTGFGLPLAAPGTAGPAGATAPGVPGDGAEGLTATAAAALEAQDALLALRTEALEPLVPQLEEVGAAAGVDTVEAMTALGATIPPLTEATVAAGATMQGTWWANNEAVAATSALQAEQHALLAQNLGVNAGVMVGHLTFLRDQHNAAMVNMRDVSGAEVATITGPIFGSLHGALTGIEQHATFTADWWGGQLGRLPILTGSPVRDVIFGPMNRGLVPAWNEIDKFFALGRHWGGVPLNFAEGTEDHRAQITGPGSPIRVWSEPETGGEAYVPLAPSKRGRSTAILTEVANRFGLDVMDRDVGLFAEGGLVAFGRRIQGMGYDVSRHGAFGGTPTSGHGPRSLHYTDQAIDVNKGAGTSAREQRELAKIVPLAREYGLRTIFMTAGHYNHAHFDTGGNRDLIGALGAGGGGVDVGAMVEEYLKATRAMIGEIPGKWGTGNIAAATERFANDAVAGAVAEASERIMVSPMGGGGAGVQRWRPVAARALALHGQPASEVDRVLMQMDSESGGNPTIVNDWDSNAAKGTPSVGLMQVIRPTFQSEADQFRNTGPFIHGVSVDPLANTYAGVGWGLHRYGSLARAFRGVGYDTGGDWPSNTFGFNASGQTEHVLRGEDRRNHLELNELLKTHRGMPVAVAPQPSASSQDLQALVAAVQGGGPRTVEIMPGATNIIPETVSIDLLAQRLAFHLASATL